jgi:hypothetical protein
MASIIKIKRSSTPGSAPGSLYAGELAVNLADKKIYSSNGSAVFEIGGSASFNIGAYITVANANAKFATKAYAASNATFQSALANTNSYIATKVSTSTFNSALANTNSYISSNYSTLNTAIGTKVSTSTFNAALANTNSYIATRVSSTTFNSALANTNSYIATKLNTTTHNTDLANTNSYIAANALIERQHLANTNSYIGTKVSTSTFNSALANTNAYISTQGQRITLVNTNLTNTNTALRLLIADRLQVSNAVATYQTKNQARLDLANTNGYIATKVNSSTFNTVLANTNSYIATKMSVANTKAYLANTNSYIATKANATNPTTSGILAHTGRATISTNLVVSGNTSVTGLKANNSLGSAGQILRTNGTTAYWDAMPAQAQYLQVANAVATYVTKVNPTTSGLLAHTGRMTISTNLAVSGNTRITGSTIIDGDLTVEGAVTYISSSTLNVDDSMIKLAANNSTDAVDVGFYGQYSSSGTKYSGFFRDASDGIYKVYTGLTVEPTSTVNISGSGYTMATIEAVIDGGTY